MSFLAFCHFDITVYYMQLVRVAFDTFLSCLLPQELIITLQNYVLDLIQRLHVVEVERRQLLSELSSLKMHNSGSGIGQNISAGQEVCFICARFFSMDGKLISNSCDVFCPACQLLCICGK